MLNKAVLLTLKKDKEPSNLIWKANVVVGQAGFGDSYGFYKGVAYGSHFGIASVTYGSDVILGFYNFMFAEMLFASTDLGSVVLLKEENTGERLMFYFQEVTDGEFTYQAMVTPFFENLQVGQTLSIAIYN